MRKILLLLLPALLLWGCRAAPHTQPTSSVVAQITAEGVFQGATIRGHFSESEQVRNILLHIRALRPRHSTIAEGEGELVRIVLTYRDGRQKQYLLKAASYWQEEGGIWKVADGTAAEKLCKLLLQLQAE